MAYTSGIPFAAGSETSFKAALQARQFIGRQGVQVYHYLAQCGARGATQREAAASLGIGRPSLCARFKALEQAGAIQPLPGTTRERCTVYQVTGPMPAQLKLL